MTTLVLIRALEDSRRENKNFCQCGCDEEIPLLTVQGKPQKYKHGHNRMWRAGKDNPEWKGGKYIYKGYVRIKKRGHPFSDKEGYIREHRLIMEEYLGRYLDPKEVVHHINGDKLDNRIQNLSLHANNLQHMETHHKKRKKKI